LLLTAAIDCITTDDDTEAIFQLDNHHSVKMNLSLASRHLQLALLTATLLHHHTAHSACNPAKKPFNNRLELKTAIDTCFEGDDAATAATIAEYNPQRCERNVKETYGWPMNEWCVGEVDDMQLLFVGKREFNEDISGEFSNCCLYIFYSVLYLFYIYCKLTS